MSYTQTRVLAAWACLVGLMTAFPPWCVDAVQYAQPRSYAVGYGFLAEPPVPEARVDGVRLGFQLLAVAALAAAHLLCCAPASPPAATRGLAGDPGGPITSVRR